MIVQPEFVERHKARVGDFIRRRKLPFERVLLHLLRKSVKSLNCWLNEVEAVTASAYSQARRKFKHTAFIELLEKCVVDETYREGASLYKSHRLLALDGTILHLPDNQEMRKEFGFVPALNRWRTTSNVEAKAAVIYDVLNEIPICSTLAKGRTSDLKACADILCNLKPNDIVIADRAYGSYEFFSELISKKVGFVIRCKRKSYGKFHGLLENLARRETVVELPIPLHIEKLSLPIPKVLKLRFIAIDLPSGEREILVTTLIDSKRYPYNDFREIYHLRWRIETFFHVLKSRLNLENFTGKSVECIKQDFYAAIFISGLESIITEDAQEQLDAKKVRYPQRVNKAISFNAIKHKILKLIEMPPDDFMEEVTAIFVKNPTSVRNQRETPPRNKGEATIGRSLCFFRSAKKYAF